MTSFGSHVDNQRGYPKCSKIIEKFPRTDFSEALKDWTKTSAGFHWCLTENKEEAVNFWNKEKI